MVTLRGYFNDCYLWLAEHFVNIRTLEFWIKQEEILFSSGCFSLIHFFIRDFLFIKYPPVWLIFKKKFPPILLFGTPVIFGFLEYALQSTYVLKYKNRSLWFSVKFLLLHSPFRLKYQSDTIFIFFSHMSIIWQNYVLKNCNTMRCRIYAEIVPSKIYTSSSNDCEMELSILINCQKSCKSKPLYSVGVSHQNNMYKSSLAQPFQPPLLPLKVSEFWEFAQTNLKNF